MNKQKIIQECKNAKACKEEFERLISAKNDKEFVEVLYNNILWVSKRLHYDLIKDVPFEWDKLDGWNWSNLLSYQPQFSKYCNWDKLYGSDWSDLLSRQPQFSKHCKWSKFNGVNWSFLLSYQPQFEEYCDWNKLEDRNWSYLLSKQPQFLKYKPKQFGYLKNTN